MQQQKGKEQGRKKKTNATEIGGKEPQRRIKLICKISISSEFQDFRRTYFGREEPRCEIPYRNRLERGKIRRDQHFGVAQWSSAWATSVASTASADAGRQLLLVRSGH